MTHCNITIQNSVVYEAEATDDVDFGAGLQGFAYGEAQELKNNAAITIIAGDKQVERVRYFNLAGVESAEPQQGVNIKVTTYTDGTTSTVKIMK